MNKEEKFLAIARDFLDEEKLVVAMCHGFLILAAEELLKGRVITGYGTTKDELISFGAHCRDCEAVVHGHLTTSRQPTNLPAFPGIREMLNLRRIAEERLDTTINRYHADISIFCL